MAITIDRAPAPNPRAVRVLIKRRRSRRTDCEVQGGDGPDIIAAPDRLWDSDAGIGWTRRKLAGRPTMPMVPSRRCARVFLAPRLSTCSRRTARRREGTGGAGSRNHPAPTGGIRWRPPQARRLPLLALNLRPLRGRSSRAQVAPDP